MRRRDRDAGGPGRVARLALGLALALAGVLAVAGGALAAPTTITYTTCPSFGQLQSDVQGINGSGTVTFGLGAANCPITATSTITLHDGASVTIDGNGLVLSGGTAKAQGNFDLIDLDSAGNLTLDHTTLEYGQNGVGAVVGTDGTLTVTSSTVRGNSGIGLVYGNVIVTNSTVSDNGSDGINGNNATVTNSTVRGNGGDGIYGDGLSFAVTDSTVSDNGGFGIMGDFTNGSATATATILAGNARNCHLAFPGLSDLGYNLSTDGSCFFSGTGSANNVAAASLELGPLANNGGPTPTQALGPGSVAVDAIPTAVVNGQAVCLNANHQPIVDPTTNQPLTTDQRGVARPQGLGCDVGAFELAFTNTAGASLSAVNFTTPYVYGEARTSGGTPTGLLDWRSPQVRFFSAHLTTLTVSGPDAVLFGTATLSTGQPVTFELDAVAGANTVRLRLSDGYDSGVVHVLSVRVSP